MTLMEDTKASRILCLVGCYGTLFYAALGSFEGLALTMAISSLLFFGLWCMFWFIGFLEGYK